MSSRDTMNLTMCPFLFVFFVFKNKVKGSNRIGTMVLGCLLWFFLTSTDWILCSGVS